MGVFEWLNGALSGGLTMPLYTIPAILAAAYGVLSAGRILKKTFDHKQAKAVPESIEREHAQRKVELAPYKTVETFFDLVRRDVDAIAKQREQRARHLRCITGTTPAPGNRDVPQPIGDLIAEQESRARSTAVPRRPFAADSFSAFTEATVRSPGARR